MASCTWRNGHRERREGKVNARFLITPGEKKRKKDGSGGRWGREGEGRVGKGAKMFTNKQSDTEGNTPGGLKNS